MPETGYLAPEGFTAELQAELGPAARLLSLVERWAGHARRFVCTVKFQGETDFAIMRRFAATPGSRLVHLHHNKHELTWLKLG